MKTLLTLFLFALPVFGQTNIGTITLTNSLGWTHDLSNVVSFKIFVGSPTGGVNGLKLLGEVPPGNRWPGTSAKLNGQHLVALKTAGRITVTNVDTMTVTNTIEDSAFSELALVTFRAGVPIPPTNLQLFSVVQAMATNALPVAPTP